MNDFIDQESIIKTNGTELLLVRYFWYFQVILPLAWKQEDYNDQVYQTAEKEHKQSLEQKHVSISRPVLGYLIFLFA